MLSKKNSRSIAVGGDPYRWSISPDSGFLTLVVQQADTNGQKLEVILKTSEDQPITPSKVAEIVQKAIRIGWKPASRNPPLQLTLENDEKFRIRRGLAE